MAANFLTEKYGPLPGWGWGAVAAGGVVLYRWWRNRQAGGAAGTPTSMTVAAQPAAVEPSASLTTPGGFSYSGPLSGLSSVVPQGAMSATSAPSIPQVGTFTGLGYAPAGGAGSEVSTGGTTYQTLQGPQQIAPLLQGGQTLFYQPTPGTFVPASSGGQLSLPGGTGTPLYLPMGG